MTNKFGRLSHIGTQSIPMAHEKVQFEVAIDLDVPYYEAASENTSRLLVEVAQAVGNAIESNESLLAAMKELGIAYRGVRVEKA